MTNLAEIFGEPISVYTREQAIEDGVLVDVSETSEYKESGWRMPVAIEAEAWEKCVAVDKGLEEQGQSIAGRLWDVLYMASLYAKRAGQTDVIYMKVSVTSHRESKNGNHLPGYKQVTRNLKITCGPGDNAEPVITIGIFNGKLTTRRR